MKKYIKIIIKNNMIDFIIVGQGLAGTILGYYLIQQNKSILIIDNNHKKSASMLSAVITNYILGQRFSLTNEALKIIPFSIAFYKQIEKIANIQLLSNLPLIRVFNNENEIFM